MFAATQPMAQPMVPEPHRVLRVQKETRDSFTLETRPVEGSRQVPFHPGQFSMLYVFGVGEVPISISGDPQKTDTLLHTDRKSVV